MYKAEALIPKENSENKTEEEKQKTEKEKENLEKEEKEEEEEETTKVEYIKQVVALKQLNSVVSKENFKEFRREITLLK